MAEHLHPTGADDDAAITRAIARQQAELDGVELLPAEVADQLELDLPPLLHEQTGWNR